MNLRNNSPKTGTINTTSNDTINNNNTKKVTKQGSDRLFPGATAAHDNNTTLRQHGTSTNNNTHSISSNMFHSNASSKNANSVRN